MTVRTPTEWQEWTGITVLDPDGWRGSGGLPTKNWCEPITEAEFRERAWWSTASWPEDTGADS